MAVSESKAELAKGPATAGVFAVCYRIFAYFGLMSLMAVLVIGFRYDPLAPWENYLFDAALYLLFVVPHLVLTREWWKQAVWGNPAGTPRERRVYILITLVTWIGVLLLHWPLPGGALELPDAVRFVGVAGFLGSMLLFFEGSTRATLDGLLGVPGSVMHYSHGAETPLYTDGPYAQVRHPMYRAVILMGVFALLAHPNAGQLFWTALLGVTFLGFIPVEEAQLRAARGDDYRRYCQQTPYRILRGVW